MGAGWVWPLRRRRQCAPTAGPPVLQPCMMPQPPVTCLHIMQSHRYHHHSPEKKLSASIHFHCGWAAHTCCALSLATYLIEVRPSCVICCEHAGKGTCGGVPGRLACTQHVLISHILIKNTAGAQHVLGACRRESRRWCGWGDCMFRSRTSPPWCRPHAARAAGPWTRRRSTPSCATRPTCSIALIPFLRACEHRGLLGDCHYVTRLGMAAVDCTYPGFHARLRGMRGVLVSDRCAQGG